MENVLGFVFYDGPSLIEPDVDIIGICTGFGIVSANVKTGPVIQAWILRKDTNPFAAMKTGLDSAVCGDCKHRHITARHTGVSPCYVHTFQGPLVIWKTFRAGKYADLTNNLEIGAELLRDKVLRLGAYGEPSAVPFDIWESLTAHTSGHLGYTHQWGNPAVDPRLSLLCMASVESLEEKYSANLAGFRTFRVIEKYDVSKYAHPTGYKKPGEVICPASSEAGRKLTCAQCRACTGIADGRKSNVVIIAH